MWEWVDSDSVPSTGTARVPTTGNGELGPLAPPLHAASDTGESCAWEYQHNRATTPFSLLYSTAVGLPFTAVHNKPNPHDHGMSDCLIYTGNSGSNFFFGFVLSIMFRRAPSFYQLRLVSLKCVAYHSFVLKRIPVKRTLSEVNIHGRPPWVYIMYVNNYQPCGN